MPKCTSMHSLHTKNYSLWWRRGYVLRHHGNFRVAGDHTSIHTIRADRPEGALDYRMQNQCSLCLWVCCYVCVCAFVCKQEGGRLFLRNTIFPPLSFFEIKTWPTQANSAVVVPDLSQRRSGREGGRGGKMKQSSTSSFRGNRKRLREKDSGSCSLETIKISLWEETDLRQRGSDRVC